MIKIIIIGSSSVYRQTTDRHWSFENKKHLGVSDPQNGKKSRLNTFCLYFLWKKSSRSPLILIKKESKERKIKTPSLRIL